MTRRRPPCRTGRRRGAGHPAARALGPGAPGERDWFAVLPDGLVVVREPAPAERSGAGGWTTSAGAWLHVGADGSVTAFTGKVDVGQDNRTALSLLVAEELRVPLAAVRLVMGDTDVCPFDAGTFGSRSMPDAGEPLRQAAASARERLLDLAAERWERGAPDARRRGWGGSDARGRQSFAAYGELVRGMRPCRVAGLGAPLTPGSASSVIGGRPARVVGRRDRDRRQALPLRPLPTGHAPRAAFSGRRPFGATLASVDIEAAGPLPGVTVVHEGYFVGVAAPDPFAAGRALRAIVATWER